jgi:hypothetical protein
MNFITDTFESQVKDIIKSLFTKLNTKDFDYITQVTLKLLDHLASCYGFKKKEKYYRQFLKNNGQDIKSLCLQLLPFVKSFDFESFSKILYNENSDKIDRNILKQNINDIIKTKFKYSNFALGLFKDDGDVLLELINEETELIENIIDTNFVALKETITVTNGKLYVNWLNVFPMNDYKKTDFYKKSMSEIEMLRNNIDTFYKLDNYGLWFGDYYNVIRNGYYESIKKIKWVIYNNKINDRRYYMIQYLTRIFNFKHFFIYDNFTNLSDEDSIKFINDLNNVSISLKSNLPIFKDVNFEKDIFKNIMMFLINNSKERFLLDRNIFGKFIMEDSDEEIIDDTDNDFKSYKDIKEITDEELYLMLDNIEPKILWNYLKDVIISLKASIYGSYLIKNNRIDNSFFNFKMDENEGIINLKNIYNIAKYLSHNNTFLPLGTNFKNLTIESQKRFFTEYFNPNVRLNRNIYYQGDGDNVNSTLNLIKTGWLKINKYIVWLYLSYNGLLSEFKVMLELTDNSELPSKTKDKRSMIQKRLFDIFDKNKQWFTANYFLTNDNYYNLNKYIVAQDNSKIYYKDSIVGRTSRTKLKGDLGFYNLIHYTFYGNDYVSQLNIFNHYINHQIMYVTGGTGTGKSTQVPKLLMYMLKMYDYNNVGKTICTQPRISPTEGNAKRISNELGVNIMVNGFKTDEYYLQYKDQKDKHIKENCPHLTLRFVTDGTLLEDLVNNPFLKDMVKKKSKKFNNDFIYSHKNKYDMVIVDEAHEHNTNMDLILTLMRQTCFLNNSVRLVIISATMDDDEPIYRSYFKYINDNLVYPIKQPIYINLEDNFRVYNARYLDRRLDISIPGQTTQYNIDEKYFDIKLTKDHKLDSINGQKAAYKHILDICRNFDIGEILLFSTGKAEIKDAINYLNQNLPAGDIALPFYSEMNGKYRDIIEKIGSKIDSIRNHRRNIAEQWGPVYKEYKDVPAGTYKRAVIVATNVAEASITIETLKFVVDTGYEKVNTFDEDIMSGVMSVQPISEASRLQRKGRVGRTSDGTVYYMYKKGAREKIKPKYKITNDDFHMSFLKLLNKSTSETQYIKEIKDDDGNVIDTYQTNQERDIVSNMLSPYNYTNFVNFDNIVNKKEFKDTYIYEKNIHNIYRKQYLNENEVDIMQYFDYFYNDENDIPIEYIKYETGYNAFSLFDTEGKLYIIHPYENTIVRNINNDIIMYKNKNKTSIDLSIFHNLIKDMETKVEYLNLNYKLDDIKKIDGRKTIYGDKIMEMSGVINNITEQESISILLGYGYNIGLEMLEIISMLKSIDGSILSLAGMDLKNPKIQEYDNFIERFKSNSDIITIYKICKLLRENLRFNIYKFYDSWLNEENFIINYRNMYYDKIKKFRKYNFTVDKNKIPKDLIEDWNLLNSLKQEGKLDKDSGFLNYIYQSSFFKRELMKDFDKSKIKILCDANYLNTNIIMKYFENLYIHITSVITSERDKEKDFEEQSPIDWIENLSNGLNNSLVKNTIEDKIINCFLFSNPLNVAFKENNRYKSMNNYNIVNIPRIFNKINTTCYGIGNYIYYNNIKIRDGYNITIIHSIDPSYLGVIFPLHYNKNNIKNTYSVRNNDETFDVLSINDINWDILVNKVINSSNINTFPLKYSKEHLPVISQYISNL